MEIEKSDSIEKKDEVIEVVKNDSNSEIISKIEEGGGESGEAVVKRKRGRPPKPKTTEMESDAVANEGNSIVTKQEETVTVTQKEHIIIQTPVKKSADDSVTEIKIEHQSGGGQNVPKKRGRPKLNKDDHAKEETKEANHETKKLEVEISTAQVIESDKKPRKNTIEKNSYDSPIRKTFEKTLKEIILLSTPGAIIPEETTEAPANKSEKVEGDKPKRGRKPKPKTEILVIDSVEKETKTISRVEEPSAEGEGVEKTPKKKGRKPKPKVDEGTEGVKASEEQKEESSPAEETNNNTNNDEKEIKKPIEIDLTSGQSTVQKSAKKEGEEKKRPGRPPKVQESNGSSSGGENKEKEKEEVKKKEVVSTTILPDFDSLKPAPKKKASEDQIALEAKQNSVIIPESETADNIHASGSGNITTTEKKRRHPGMDVTNEKFKDKLRENLVKYFENERGKAVKDNKQQSAPAPAPKNNNNQQAAPVQKKDQAPPKPAAPKNEIPTKPADQPSMIEIEDTPEKILIEDEKEYKIPKKSSLKDFNDHRTPPRKITMEEEIEESADKAITIKTTPRDASLDLIHKEEVSSIQSPGEYLNMETDPFLNSGLEAELKKDWLKQDEMFADENSRSKELENKDNENAGDFEPGKVKKLKIHDDHESAMLRSMGQNLGDDFPIGDAPDGEYSISQFLN